MWFHKGGKPGADVLYLKINDFREYNLPYNPPFVQPDFTGNPGPTDFSTILPNWAYVNCHLSKCLSSHIDSEHSVAEVSPNLPL